MKDRGGIATRVDATTGIEVAATRGDRNKALHGDARRKRVEQLNRMPQRALRVLQADNAESARELGAVDRPRTRADCAGVPRPCPFVGCKWSLYMDVSPRTGNITLNAPGLEPGELPAAASCALDVAEHGGVPLEVIGSAMRLTRERVRQIEEAALKKVLAAAQLQQREHEWRDALEEAVARSGRGTPLALEMDAESRQGGSAGPAEDEPEEGEREYVPRLPSIFDASVSEQQYCAAFRALWADHEARRRAPETAGKPGENEAEKSAGQGVQKG